MKLDQEDIHKFLKRFSANLRAADINGEAFDDIELRLLSQTECLYIIDFRLNEMTFKKGFLSFLGYQDKNLNLESYLRKIHPDDMEMVSKIGKATILHTSVNPGENENNVLYISFRIQKKSGEYVKVLSQSSVYETDSDGNMISSLVKVSDISFMEDNDLVKFNFVAQNLDEEGFNKSVYGENYSLFTSRELDIISEIEKGSTNLEIASNLGISKHTVASHRKKIMKKSGSHSAEELLYFCRKNGIV
ncbi:LuxR C-terminal-related transcriptional regulator [Lutimonas saemankumensis]|uniref:LuxR C-terminal-related transcriptional regulator n=1 Tax=Lutimonas saemankumensis TaxID=483016 RepID=UPI001CD5DF5B|nr:LuxR C-terminal-related transcriptional regulator [Lutimonas saemankumensis]MCA0932662.1 LuxR C-terminal-related transcriptional regulator [Lutimonas saemankumensis]